MFYEQLSTALNDYQSSGWLKVAQALHLTPEELLFKVEQQELTFEQCIEATYASKSIDLLKYVLRLFNPNFMNDWEMSEIQNEEKTSNKKEKRGRFRVMHDHPYGLN